MITVEFKSGIGETIGMIVAEVKDFKTGSRGFFGTGKIVINDKRYQTQVQLVEIGSKPKDGKEKSK
jgi:hypothetical protein